MRGSSSQRIVQRGDRCSARSFQAASLRAEERLRRAAAARDLRTRGPQPGRVALAREFHLPLLATNTVSMATEFEREILDVLTSIRHGCSLHEAGLLLQQNGRRHLRSASEMSRLFEDVPEAIAATNDLPIG